MSKLSITANLLMAFLCGMGLCFVILVGAYIYALALAGVSMICIAMAVYDFSSAFARYHHKSFAEGVRAERYRRAQEDFL